MSAHFACILTIGDELLNGDVMNANAAWLGQVLRAAGIPCKTMVTVGDRQSEILEALQFSWKQHELVVVTGGLGPTRDDVTKTALLAFFEDHLIRDQAVLGHVTEYFRKRGREISEENRHQADVPSRSRVLFNDLGTAPGLFIEKDGKFLAAMPGVPYEMRHITENRLLPELKKRWHKSERRVQQQYFRTTGIGESVLSDLLLSKAGIRVPVATDLAFLPHPRGVDIRITRLNGDRDSLFEDFVAQIRKAARSFIFSEEYDKSLAETVVRLLADQEKTIAVAESCTGGSLADEITDTPGSSNCFKGGIVAYDNRVKSGQLGILPEDITRHGAVSDVVALAMAKSAGELLDADFGISTTGIAGPGGGTDAKPVGTVWIGFWARSGTHFAGRFQFTTERRVNKDRSVAAALEILRRHLQDIPGLPHHPEVATP